MATSSLPFNRRLIEWSRSDRAAGVTLAAATVAALAWANLDAAGYSRTWATVSSWLTFTGLHFTAREWVNEALMTLFFVVIGLEIRRETTAGELGSWRRAAAPVVAAVAGMVVPALVYAAVVHDGPGGHGWGIPMATDVAFSLGALALLAPAASLRLRVFLMTLGVADDILSILVLVVLYSTAVDPAFVLAGVGSLVVMVLVRTIRGPGGALGLLFGGVAWWLFARGGVEAAVVGVVIGVAGLASAAGGDAHHLGPRAWEHRLNPVVNLVVLPVFALANTGVDVGHLDLTSSGALAVFVGVLLARVVGKPVGVWLGATVMPSRFVSPSEERPSARTRLGLGTAASVGF
ncbi:MAG TPA: Na+/H+ antiporter NhaA, partial [Mycobacteriales bacterium]|nr:Na+/H+ antiporter NhaA [Mycobacteriales bacterium]